MDPRLIRSRLWLLHGDFLRVDAPIEKSPALLVGKAGAGAV